MTDVYAKFGVNYSHCFLQLINEIQLGSNSSTLRKNQECSD